jgi:hypothetical protein
MFEKNKARRENNKAKSKKLQQDLEKRKRVEYQDKLKKHEETYKLKAALGGTQDVKFSQSAQLTHRRAQTLDNFHQLSQYKNELTREHDAEMGRILEKQQNALRIKNMSLERH